MQIIRDLTPFNHAKGRAGWDVDAIVIHVMQGNMQGTRSWFHADRSNVSSTYGVSRMGAVVQYVEEHDTHAANGIKVRPSAPLVLERPGVNPNLYTISIEFEGTGRDDLTDIQRTVGARLIVECANRHPKIKLNERHIFGHRKIRADKDCPGAINMDKLLAAVRIAAVPLTPLSLDYPRAVWSGHFRDWLIVTRYASDKDWSFVPLKDIKSKATKAQTPLSQMPLKPS